MATSRFLLHKWRRHKSPGQSQVPIARRYVTGDVTSSPTTPTYEGAHHTVTCSPATRKHLEIDIVLRFKVDGAPKKGNEYRFWVLIPNNLLNRYRKSCYDFLKDLLSPYSAKAIHKLQQIGTCQYVHHKSEGIAWLFRRNGVIYLWDDQHHSAVNRECRPFRKLKKRLIAKMCHDSFNRPSALKINKSTAFKRYHIRDAKLELPPHCQCMLSCNCTSSSHQLAKDDGITRFASNMLAPRRHIAFAQALDLYERCRSAYKFDVDRESEIVDLIGQCIDSVLGPSALNILDFEWIYHSIRFTHDQHWKTILVLILMKNKETAPIWWSGYDESNRRSGYRESCSWILSDLFYKLGLWKKARKYLLKLKAMRTKSEWKFCDWCPFDIHRNIELLQCEVCGVRGTINSGCSGCNQVFYCGKRCQKRDWKRKHRMECGREFVKMKGVPRETFKGWCKKIRFLEKGEVISVDGRFKAKIIQIVQEILEWSMIKKRHEIEFQTPMKL